MERPSALGRWIDRNGKWIVLASMLAFVCLAAAGVFLFFQWFDGYMRGLPPYRMAMQELRSNQEASRALGPPIVSSGLIQGNFHHTTASSRAELAIPVQGSKAKGKLFVRAGAVGNDWRLEVVTLESASLTESLSIIRRE